MARHAHASHIARHASPASPRYPVYFCLPLLHPAACGAALLKLSDTALVFGALQHPRCPSVVQAIIRLGPPRRPSPALVLRPLAGLGPAALRNGAAALVVVTSKPQDRTSASVRRNQVSVLSACTLRRLNPLRRLAGRDRSGHGYAVRVAMAEGGIGHLAGVAGMSPVCRA